MVRDRKHIRLYVFTSHVWRCESVSKKTKPIDYKGSNGTEETVMKLSPTLLHASYNSLLFGTSNM